MIQHNITLLSTHFSQLSYIHFPSYIPATYSIRLNFLVLICLIIMILKYYKL